MPFNFVNNLMTNNNATQNAVRVNIKADRIYAVTNMVQTSNGPIRFQGWTNTVGDLGKALITGSTVGQAHVILTCNGANTDFVDFMFATNGVSFNAVGVSSVGTEQMFIRCGFSDIRNSGLSLNTTACGAFECEAYRCNTGNQSAHGGFGFTASAIIAVRCYAHHNAGALNSGFITGTAIFMNCIAASNGQHGFKCQTTTAAMFYNCDAYNNVGSGFDCDTATGASPMFENCNAFHNGLYGINSSVAFALRNGRVANCMFGSGGMTNSSGSIPNNVQYDLSNIMQYADNVTPWVDPTNGNFTMSAGASTINAGRGTFTEFTVFDPTNTVSYPDIGAAQATNAAGGTTTILQGYPIFRR
jgi:hypothetical protein